MNEDRSEATSWQKSREMKLFPPSLDARSSTLFMKRILFIIVSDIMKKRPLFPLHTFRDFEIDGLKCWIVTEETDLGKKLSALLYAISEAIAKHYLRDLLILVSTEETDNIDEVIEVYTLTFTYAGGGGLLFRSSSHEIRLSCGSVTELRKQVIALLHRLDIFMNMLAPIPQNAFPYFKLTYYSGTPYDYEPVGFKSSPTTYHFKEMTFISKISVGRFSTKFESCTVYLESVFFEDTEKQHEQTVSTGSKKPQKIVEAGGNKSELMPFCISSSDAVMEVLTTSSKESGDEIMESVRSSLSGENFSNKPDETEKVILKCVEALISTTDLHMSDSSLEYLGDSEEVPESSGQFATFGSPSGPYINSPLLDSTVSLPTVTEAANRGSILNKASEIEKPSSEISISSESDTTSPDVRILSTSEPKAKKMKISRSKADYNKDPLGMILWWNAPYNRLLHLSFVFAVVPWLYSYFNEQHRKQSYSVEQSVMLAWDKVITQPTMLFRRVVIGINCNVDMVVAGTSLLERLNITPTHRRDHEVISNVSDLYESFAYFFSRGAAAERHMLDPKVFHTLVQFASEPRHRPHYYIGGNAALMAEKIATSFPRTTAYLVGPIGPRSQVLLHPSIVRTNSTRIVKDELHVIMEYKQGEILGEYVAPASSRFIASHDQYSGSAVVIEMFFKAISQFNPDLVILTGVHHLQNQNKEMRMEKLRLIKRSLLQVEHNIPIHFELGNMGNPDHVAEVLKRIVPHVDSLGLNEQELAFFSNVGNGPYTHLYPVFPGALHVHKVVEMLYWLLTKFGHDSSDPESENYKYRLSRIHFQSLTFHLMVYKGTDWSNLAAGLAAGAKVAARQSCKITSDLNTDDLELRISKAHLLDKELGKQYVFEPHRPIASWMRNDVVFIYTPALICKFPTRTVGTDDAVSATALIFSQFYRFSSWAATSLDFNSYDTKATVGIGICALDILFLVFEMAFFRKHALHHFLKKFRSSRNTSSGSDGSTKWLNDASTYADVQASFVDPCTSLPYPEKELYRLFKNKLPKVTTSDTKTGGNKSRSTKLDFSQIPIEEQVVVLFPGQGTQHVGMGTKVLDCNKAVDVYKEASEILQYDLLKLCLEGPKSKLDQTLYCQPAVFVSSLAAWEKAKAEDETLTVRLTEVAGFSVGEFAALVLAEILSFEDALRLVKIRAEAMHQCSLRQSSGMLAIRVNAATRLEEALEEAKTYASEKDTFPVCEVANYLFCGMKVIGATENCIRFLENNQEKYVFQIVKRLAVSGAFHTTLMKDAADTLKIALKDVKINQQPRINIYSNYTGKLHIYREKQIREAIIRQVCSPVKWEQIQQLLHAKHQDYKFPTYMEVGPGKQLGTMLLKISKKAYNSYVSCAV
uniref:HORMA domain-containing protein n=1 Tax=Setaria digitata TaxID=48799 RepID=A0A915PPU9_9BILA